MCIIVYANRMVKLLFCKRAPFTRLSSRTIVISRIQHGQLSEVVGKTFEDRNVRIMYVYTCVVLRTERDWLSKCTAGYVKVRARDKKAYTG